MTLSYIKYDQVDRQKWDECIFNSHNALIYGTSAFLDKMAGCWDAVIEGDYESVMPLPFRKKFGIRYVYQPAFMQQGGIFSREQLQEDKIEAFLKEAFRHFMFAEFTLNYSNKVPSNFRSVLRANYIIPPDDDLRFGIITQEQKFYRELDISTNAGLSYVSSADIGGAVKLYGELYSKRLPYFKPEDFQGFSELCVSQQENVIVRNVMKGTKLHAQCLLFRYKDRLYNLVNNVTPAGRESSANYFLFNELVKEFAANGLTLDLEGSDVQGIAFFYKKLGSIEQPYPFVRHNGLPWPLNLLKRVW